MVINWSCHICGFRPKVLLGVLNVKNADIIHKSIRPKQVNRITEVIPEQKKLLDLIKTRFENYRGPERYDELKKWQIKYIIGTQVIARLDFTTFNRSSKGRSSWYRTFSLIIHRPNEHLIARLELSACVGRSSMQRKSSSESSAYQQITVHLARISKWCIKSHISWQNQLSAFTCLLTCVYKTEAP